MSHFLTMTDRALMRKTNSRRGTIFFSFFSTKKPQSIQINWNKFTKNHLVLVKQNVTHYKWTSDSFRNDNDSFIIRVTYCPPNHWNTHLHSCQSNPFLSWNPICQKMRAFIRHWKQIPFWLFALVSIYFQLYLCCKAPIDVWNYWWL